MSLLEEQKRAYSFKPDRIPELTKPQPMGGHKPRRIIEEVNCETHSDHKPGGNGVQGDSVVIDVEAIHGGTKHDKRKLINDADIAKLDSALERVLSDFHDEEYILALCAAMMNCKSLVSKCLCYSDGETKKWIFSLMTKFRKTQELSEESIIELRNLAEYLDQFLHNTTIEKPRVYAEKKGAVGGEREKVAETIRIGKPRKGKRLTDIQEHTGFNAVYPPREAEKQIAAGEKEKHKNLTFLEKAFIAVLEKLIKEFDPPRQLKTPSSTLRRDWSADNAAWRIQYEGRPKLSAEEKYKIKIQAYMKAFQIVVKQQIFDKQEVENLLISTLIQEGYDLHDILRISPGMSPDRDWYKPRYKNKNLWQIAELMIKAAQEFAKGLTAEFRIPLPVFGFPASVEAGSCHLSEFIQIRRGGVLWRGTSYIQPDARGRGIRISCVANRALNLAEIKLEKGVGLLNAPPDSTASTITIRIVEAYGNKLGLHNHEKKPNGQYLDLKADYGVPSPDVIQSMHIIQRKLIDRTTRSFLVDLVDKYTEQAAGNVPE